MNTISDDAFVRLFQGRFGLEVDGWAGREVLAKLDEIAPPAASAPSSEPGGDIPDSYWPMLSKIESGDRPYIKASTSSASGLFQFIRATWIGEGGRGGLCRELQQQDNRTRHPERLRCRFGGRGSVGAFLGDGFRTGDFARPSIFR